MDYASSPLVGPVCVLSDGDEKGGDRDREQENSPRKAKAKRGSSGGLVTRAGRYTLPRHLTLTLTLTLTLILILT